MNRLWTVLALVASLCVAMPATASAERASWKAKNVDFSAIQTITVPDAATWQTGTYPSDIDRLKVRNRLDETTIKALSNYTVRILPVAVAIEEQNQEAFTEQSNKELSIASPHSETVTVWPTGDVATNTSVTSTGETRAPADAQVHINITKWQYRQYWVEPQLYTTYRTIRHYDRWGHVQYWTVPVERVRPGYYVTTAYMTAHFTVTDASGRTIYETIDSRSANKDPADMFGRALSQFYSEFNEIGREAK